VKRTNVTSIIGMGVATVIVGYLLELLLQSLGFHLVLPPYSLSLTLGAIAFAAVALAIPIRRRVTGKRKEPLSPFYAVRVAVLGKSSTLVGALLLGLGIGITIFVVTRPNAPGWDLIGPGVAQIVGSALLLAAGIITEHLCTLPPDDDDKEGVRDSATRA
jgi:hypothetical protein